MAAPWEKYAAQSGGDGPWAKYAAPQPDTSAARAFGLGVLKPVDNLRTAIRAIPGVGDALEFVRTEVVGRQPTGASVAANQAARANNTRSGFQLAGNIAGTLPTLALPGGAAVQGAAGGALLSDADTAGGVVRDAAIGAVASKVGERALRGVGNALAPQLGKAQRVLADAGISMTPGQASNGFVRSAEEIAMSVPGVRTVIEGARDRGTEDFNRVIINRALKHLGKELPKGTAVGRDAVAFLADTTSDAYAKLTPRLQLKPDAIFKTALQKAEQEAKALPGDGLKAFKNAIGDNVLTMLRKGQTLDGAGLKVLESRLSKQAAAFKRSGDAYQNMAGDVVQDVLGELRNALMRSNPGARAELKALNRAFAEQVRIERAAGAAGSSDGVFTAKGYQAAVRANDSSSRKAAFARGRALNQDLSDAAASVLPNRLPDSGTAIRMTPAALAAAGIGGGSIAWGPLMAAGAAALPYTGAGQRAVNALIARPGATREAAGNAVNALAPVAARVAPAVAVPKR